MSRRLATAFCASFACSQALAADNDIICNAAQLTQYAAQFQAYISHCGYEAPQDISDYLDRFRASQSAYIARNPSSVPERIDEAHWFWYDLDYETLDLCGHANYVKYFPNSINDIELKSALQFASEGYEKDVVQGGVSCRTLEYILPPD